MYEEVTISSTHPDCVEECLWCTNRVEAGTIAPQREGGSREAVLSENLCPPRTCALREPVPSENLCPPRTCATREPVPPSGTADIAES